MKFDIKSLSTILTFLIFVNYLNTVSADILPAPQKIADHSYAWIGPLDGPSVENNGYRMNLGFVVGAKSVLVVDSGYTIEMAKEMVAHIQKITTLPIKYAVNTNSQPHRFYGNAVFKKLGAILITQPKELKRMDTLNSNYSSAIERILKRKNNSVALAVLPTLLIKNQKEFDLGGLKVLVKTLGASHTPSSLIVKVAKDKIIFTGDILYGDRLLAVVEDSNVSEWIKSYKKLRQFKGYTMIPGHGQPGPLSDFNFSTLSYLELLHKHMTTQVEKDAGANAAIQSLNQSVYSNLANFDLLSGKNASWSYLQAESAAFD
jgi:glyoxylase-like metal-dependent hydrolase (beta-lactamase superfamily II)